jgi:hypothetical protein
MAVDPNTLLPGTLADANEVQLKFDQLFTDIDDSNIASGAGIQVDKLEAMTTGEIIVGTAAGTGAVVTMSGGATIDDAGVVTLSGTFPSGSMRLEDTAGDHDYIFTAGGDLAADRNVTLPLLTGNDTFVFESHAQTLNNKTLLSPTIANFSNAQHNHENAAGGGTLDTAAIASGTFADARISASNVTQHEGSIDHNALSNLAWRS